MSPLDVPEILDAILKSLPSYEESVRGDARKLYTKCAHVCKGWSEQCLDLAWREVDDQGYLLRLLGDLEFNEDSGQYHYIDLPIKPDGWERFKKYSPRVQFIREFSWTYEPAHAALAYDRPCLVLLPNLRSIDSTVDPSLVRIFAHEGVDQACITESSRGVPLDIESITALIPNRMPKLRVLAFIEFLDIQLPTDDPNIPLLWPMLKALPLLREVRLPASLFSEEVARGLSRHQFLEAIRVHASFWEEQEDVFSDAFDESSYPALKSIDLDISFRRAIRCFSKRFAVNTLRRIAITAFYDDPATVGADLVALLARNWPLVESLKVCVGGYDVPYAMTAEESLDVIRPLLSCNRLSLLTLTYPLPLHLARGDLLLLFESLPSLRSLTFADAVSRTIDPRKTFLALGVLADIALVAPCLEHFGMPMSCPAGFDKTGDTPIQKFNRLQELDLCNSPLRRPPAVANFLHRVLPDWCAVTWGGGVSNERRKWDEVAALLGQLRGTRP
ncbi:hypothetical protein ONZ45_g14268 [Pleurotus djamor]|nr:hypothetical protein ONZ45_g14268 [Pleurotus djamor]